MAILHKIKAYLYDNFLTKKDPALLKPLAKKRTTSFSSLIR